MKAEERKELETNVLADRVGKMVQKMKGGPSRRAVFWVVVVGAIAVGVFFYIRSRNLKAREKAEGWEFLALTRNKFIPQQRQEFQGYVIQKYAKDKSGLAATVNAVWSRLDDAIKGINKAGLFDSLKALASYEALIESLDDKAKEEPMLRAELAFQRAMVRETRAILDFIEIRDTPKAARVVDPDEKHGKLLESAKELFEKVSADFADTPYADMAAKQLEQKYSDKTIHETRVVYSRMAIDLGLATQMVQAERILLERKATEDDE